MSQGFSFRSRTNFFRWLPLRGTSTASNPARSMTAATASIMPIRILAAHRLWGSSRNVVSIKHTYMTSLPSQKKVMTARMLTRRDTGAAIEGQIARWNIGLILAFDGHLAGPFCGAANPGDRHHRRIFHHGRTEGEDLAVDETIRTVAECDVNCAVVNQDRADGVVDNLVGGGQ